MTNRLAIALHTPARAAAGAVAAATAHPDVAAGVAVGPVPARAG